MARLIAVGLDGSESSWRALAEAIHQAKSDQTVLHAITVQEDLPVSHSAVEILSADEASNEHITQIRLLAEQQSAGTGVKLEFHVCTGDGPKALLECAKSIEVDLLIIGKKGRSSLWSALVGTSVDKIVRDSHCSVLVVK